MGTGVKILPHLSSGKSEADFETWLMCSSTNTRVLEGGSLPFQEMQTTIDPSDEATMLKC